MHSCFRTFYSFVVPTIKLKYLRCMSNYGMHKIVLYVILFHSLIHVYNQLYTIIRINYGVRYAYQIRDCFNYYCQLLINLELSHMQYMYTCYNLNKQLHNKHY